MDAAEYKHLVLGLIFVKYISDTFAAHRATLTARLTNPDDEYFYGDADPADIAAELEDRDYYKEANVFWVVDWTERESVQAKLRLIVKRILRKYKYPPDREAAAVELVLQQAQALGESWVAA